LTCLVQQITMTPTDTLMWQMRKLASDAAFAPGNAPLKLLPWPYLNQNRFSPNDVLAKIMMMG